MQGPDVGDVLAALQLEDGDIVDSSLLVDVPSRIQQLRTWALPTYDL